MSIREYVKGWESSLLLENIPNLSDRNPEAIAIDDRDPLGTGATPKGRCPNCKQVIDRLLPLGDNVGQESGLAAALLLEDEEIRQLLHEAKPVSPPTPRPRQLSGEMVAGLPVPDDDTAADRERIKGFTRLQLIQQMAARSEGEVVAGLPVPE